MYNPNIEVELNLAPGCIRHVSINVIDEMQVRTANNVTILVDGENYGDVGSGETAWDYVQSLKFELTSRV